MRRLRAIRPDVNDLLIVGGMLLGAIASMYINPLLMLVVAGLLVAMIGLVRAR